MKGTVEHQAATPRPFDARTDLMTGAIVAASLLIFVGTGSRVLPEVIGVLAGTGEAIDRPLATALILNVALILFGWRRYSDLTAEIEHRIASEAQARLLASRDPLTGFFNRRAVAEHGAELLDQAARRRKPVAMLMFDLDNFKNVNDAHGHAVGDSLLKAVAAEIERLIPPHAIACRLGGDEFACMFIFDEGGVDTVGHTADRIVARLAEPFDAAGVCAYISVSCGMARSDVECTTIEALMRRSDIAMYAAKNQGRNRATWFDASMERELQARNSVEDGLRSGIPAGEFVPFFEQQVDLATGALHGFEMLARWLHPVRGVVPPDVFIPVAEATGMISDLSLAIMRAALLEARHWHSSLTISVNISPVQLKDPWLAQKLVKLLTETGFPAHRLEVEITESSLFENLPLAQSIVGSLKNQGIKLALDDFGTGYSSLAHLRALPFDRIKIDKSFVTSIIANSESAAIVSAVTRLGQSLGLSITAEGIEDVAIKDRLEQLGCHKGQGWLFGKPLPMGDIPLLLAKHGMLADGAGEMVGNTAEPQRRIGAG